jgi:hypothetical protein
MNEGDLAEHRSMALLICGALAKEVITLRDAHGWDADVWAVPAKLHMTPNKIAPAVRTRLEELRQQYARLIVVYGDCGTSGALDKLLDEMQVPRVAGPHCYEMYAGAEGFDVMIQEEVGTFFLTDFLLRQFDALVVKELGLDRYPFLRDDYFGNYRRVVYLAQQEPTPAMLERAQAAADKLGLALEVRQTGMGDLEQRLIELIAA